MNTKVKKMMMIALLSGIAFICCATIKVPVVLFLSYEPKDVIITLGGFLLGPLNAFFISVIVSFIEMITISSTGPIGFLMNVFATCSFACVASYIYSKNRTLKGAIIGLIIAVFTMTAVMIAWNYLITPIYMKIDREIVKGYLIPAFLPFNLLKGGMNAAITLIIYKPLVIPLFARFHLIDAATAKKGKVNIGVILGALFVLVTCIFFVLVLKGVI